MTDEAKEILLALGLSIGSCVIVAATWMAAEAYMTTVASPTKRSPAALPHIDPDATLLPPRPAVHVRPWRVRDYEIKRVCKRRNRKVKAENVEKVIAALCRVESNNKSDAIGDSGRACGILQIWTCMVAEANRIAGKTLYHEAQRLDAATSREMARVVLNHYAKTKRLGNTHEDMVRLGGLWNRPDGGAPAQYLAKVDRELRGAE